MNMAPITISSYELQFLCMLTLSQETYLCITGLSLNMNVKNPCSVFILYGYILVGTLA